MRTLSSGPQPESPRNTGGRVRRLVPAVLGAALCAGCILDLAPPLIEQEGGLGPSPTNGPTPAPTDVGETETDDVSDTDSTPTDEPMPTDVDPGTDLTDADVPGTDEPNPTDPDPEGCGTDEEQCDAGCVPAGECVQEPTCEETCSAPNAVTECVDEVCHFVECDAAWVDCDGSLMDGLVEDLATENGCETEFGTGVSDQEPLPISSFASPNPGQDDWAQRDVFRMLETCSVDECGMDHPEVPAQADLFVNVVPDTDADLRAGFSMGWDSTGLWIRVLLLDDEWIDAAMVGDAAGQTPDARKYDHVEFVFDGNDPSRYGEPEDHHLFMGIDEQVFDQRENNLNTRVSVDVETFGICRIMESKLSEGYLSSTSPTSVLEAGNVFGFSIAVNDFDIQDSEVQRQHRLFYKNPGPAYVYGGEGSGRNLPTMTLLETTAAE